MLRVPCNLEPGTSNAGHLGSVGAFSLYFFSGYLLIVCSELSALPFRQKPNPLPREGNMVLQECAQNHVRDLHAIESNIP